MSGISMDFRQPKAAMAEIVSFFYQFSQSDERFETVDRADLAQFRFVLRGRGRYRFIDGVEQEMPDIYVQGPTTGAVTVSGEGDVDCVGVGLLPAGWAALVPMDASAASNRLFDARDLFGDVVTGAQAALRATNDFDERVEVIEALLARLATVQTSPYRNFVVEVNGWLADSVLPDVTVLIERTGLSRSQIERSCKRYFGAPPKLLARKYRALRAAVAIAHHDANLNDLIAEGFYDQSHLIREMKHFTGMTPGSFEKHPTELNQQIIKRIKLERQNPMRRSTLIM